MSPYFQRPIELGADIVMHSTTKFLNGHSDGLGGVLVTTRASTRRVSLRAECTGGILSPFEAWLVLRGVKTLAVRMRQHDANGRAVAEYLSQHPKVRRVFYPGLASIRSRACQAADVWFRLPDYFRDWVLSKKPIPCCAAP